MHDSRAWAQRVAIHDALRTRAPHVQFTMQPSLTDHTRQVLDAAQQEARSLNQEFVGTEHLFLAVLGVSGTHALRILRQQHVDREAVRTSLRSVLPFSETAPVVTGALPLSPKVQRVLNSALVMSRSLREPKLSSRVLLLALLDSDGAPLLKCLRDTGADVEQLLQSLSEKPADVET